MTTNNAKIPVRTSLAPGLSREADSTARPKRRVGLPALAGLLVVLLGLVAWNLSRLPWFQEQRLSRLSLAQLQQEQQAHDSRNPLLLYYIGRHLNDAGKFAEADGYLREAVGGDPGVARYRDAWARALLGSGNTTAAFGQLREFAGTHPDSGPAHLLLGKFYVTQNSLRRAIEELTTATRLDAHLGEAWAFLAVAHQNLNEVHLAREAAENAARIRPRNVGDWVLLGTLRNGDSDIAGARQAFEEAFRLDSDSALVQRAFAGFLLHGDANDLARAATLAEKAVAQKPDDATTMLIMGQILVRQGKLIEALPYLEKAAELSPVEPAPALAVTQTLKRLGRSAEAETWLRVHQAREQHVTERERLRSVLELNPRDASTHRRFAHLLAEEGDINGCVRHHADALHKTVDSPLALATAAQDLVSVGRAQEALPLAQRAYDQTHSSPVTVEALGDTLLALKRPDEAIQHYHRLIAWDARRYPYFRAKMDRYYAAEEATGIGRAETLYQQSRAAMQGQLRIVRVPQEALQLAEEAVRLAPDNAVYLRHLLMLQYQAKQLAGAIQTGKHLLTLIPEDAPTMALLGVMLADQGNSPQEFSEAESYLQKVRIRQELAATYQYGLGLLALKRDKPAEAVTALREAARLDPRPMITFYKLAAAEARAGHPTESARAKAEYDRRHQETEAEGQALFLLGATPNDPRAYEKAAAVFESFGRHEDAAAIRAAMPTTKSRSTQQKATR